MRLPIINSHLYIYLFPFITFLLGHKNNDIFDLRIIINEKNDFDSDICKKDT